MGALGRLLTVASMSLLILAACSSQGDDADALATATDIQSGMDVNGEVSNLSDVAADNGPCTPNCLGKVCGGNGCGGQCGTCSPDATCQSGQCVGADGDVLPMDNAPWDAFYNIHDVSNHDSTESDTYGADILDTMAWDYGTSDLLDGGTEDYGSTEVWIGYDSALTDTIDWDEYDWDYGNWDYGNWDGNSWDGYNWDSYNWDGYNWDGYNWDGMSWDFGPLDGISFGDSSGECGDITTDGICEGEVLKWCGFDGLVIDDCSAYGANCHCAFLPEWDYYDCDGDCW